MPNVQAHSSRRIDPERSLSDVLPQISLTNHDIKQSQIIKGINTKQRSYVCQIVTRGSCKCIRGCAILSVSIFGLTETPVKKPMHHSLRLQVHQLVEFEVTYESSIVAEANLLWNTVELPKVRWVGFDFRGNCHDLLKQKNSRLLFRP